MNTLTCPDNYTYEWNEYVVPHMRKIKDTIYNYEYCFETHYYRGIKKYNDLRSFYEKYKQIHNSIPPNFSCDELNAIINEDKTYFVIEYFKNLKEDDYFFK